MSGWKCGQYRTVGNHCCTLIHINIRLNLDHRDLNNKRDTFYFCNLANMAAYSTSCSAHYHHISRLRITDLQEPKICCRARTTIIDMILNGYLGTNFRNKKVFYTSYDTTVQNITDKHMCDFFVSIKVLGLVALILVFLQQKKTRGKFCNQMSGINWETTQKREFI